jgi:hypothetical protein
MKRMHHKCGAKTLLVLGLLLTLLVLALSVPAGAAKKSRPFKGTMYGAITYVPDPSSPPFYMDTISNATGTLSHMGSSVLYGQHVSNFQYNGDMTLTAANGDTIQLAYSYTGNAVPPATIGVWYDMVNDVTVLGGTGRFHNATGDVGMTVSLQFMGLETPEWPAIYRFSGTLKY